MSKADSEAETESDTSDRAEHFFSGAYWARLLFMALLLATAAGTIAQATWRLAQTREQTTGEFVEVAESRTGSSSAIYSLVLRNEQGDLAFVRLRNNGRIQRYLMKQGNRTMGKVIVEQSHGIASNMSLVDVNNLLIRESMVSPLIQLVIGVLLLIVFALHIWPR